MLCPSLLISLSGALMIRLWYE